MSENSNPDSVSEENPETPDSLPDSGQDPSMHSRADVPKRSSVMLRPRPAAKKTSQQSAPDGKTEPPRRSGFDPTAAGVKKRGSIFLFFGVLLPLAAMSFELVFHFCAANFFDPFPSPAHVVLFALIPFSNFLLWLATRRDLSQHLGFMSLASGMATGVGVLYTLMFLPLTPSSCLWVMALGFGLLGLAPLLSLPCSFLAGKAVCDIAHRKTTYFNAHQLEHIGHLIILVMVVAVELPSTLTRINIARAAESATAQSGIDWLRKYGSREVMLRACYERSGRATDILGSLYESNHPIDVDTARAIFFRVTGKPFNAVVIPAGARATLKHIQMAKSALDFNAGVDDEFDIDTDIAGENVGTVARGLSTSTSTLKINANADAAIAKIDWKLTFKNESKIDREARAKILLPAGAVVERAYITLNGVEKLATIQGAALARAIYQQAAVERKDPLLVSSCGRDMILLQCYPVSAQSELSVRLVIASPLQIEKDDKATLCLPAFEEKNFQSDKTRLELPPNQQIATTIPLDKDQSLSTSKISDFGEILSFSRTASPGSYYKINANSYLIRQTHKTTYPSTKELFVVVDGSECMEPYLAQISDGLSALPAAMDLHVSEVIDKNIDLNPLGAHGETPQLKEALTALRERKPTGGQDDNEALLVAVNRAGHSNGSVLWIHGPQPVQRQYADRAFLSQFNSTCLYDLEVTAGPNVIAGALDTLQFIRVPHTGTVAGDIRNLLGNIKASGSETGASPASDFSEAEQAPPGMPEAPDEILALYAMDQFERQLPVNPQMAQGTALAAGIVSPLTSAIVTDDQSHFTPKDNRDKFTTLVDDSWNLVQALTVNPLESKVKEAFQYQVDRLNSLSSAAGGPVSSGGAPIIIGAPVDPRYGQSNEIGSTTRSAMPMMPSSAPVALPAKKTSVLWKQNGDTPYVTDARESAGAMHARKGEIYNEQKPAFADDAKQREESQFGASGGGTSGGAYRYRRQAQAVPVPGNEPVGGYNLAKAPTLQGAVNGTIAPQEKEAALADRKISALKDADIESQDKLQGVNTAGTVRMREGLPEELTGILSPAQSGMFKFLSTITLFFILPLTLIALFIRRKR